MNKQDLLFNFRRDRNALTTILTVLPFEDLDDDLRDQVWMAISFTNMFTHAFNDYMLVGNDQDETEDLDVFDDMKEN